MKRINFQPFNNIPTDGRTTAGWRAPFPMTVFGIELTLGGTTFTDAEIDGITVKIGPKVIVPRISGTRLELLNSYEGLTADATKLPIMFGDVTAQTPRGRWMGGIDTSIYQQDITVEVEISGATAPELSAQVLYGPPKSQILNAQLTRENGLAYLHRAFLESNESFTGATTDSSVRVALGGSQAAFLKRVAMFSSILTHIDVKEAGLAVFERVAVADNKYLQGDVFERSPQSGLDVWDLIVDGDYSNAKRTVTPGARQSDILLRLSTSGSGDVDIFSDILTTPDNI